MNMHAAWAHPELAAQVLRPRRDGCHEIALRVESLDDAIVDLERSWTGENAGMHSDAGFSIYDGWRFKGKVIHTMVRGRFAYRDEQLCADAVGHGQYLRRTRSPANNAA